jgi:splicing factor 3B subunit 1
VESQYIKDEIHSNFSKHFWNNWMALDRRNYRQVICNIMLTHCM